MIPQSQQVHQNTQQQQYSNTSSNNNRQIADSIQQHEPTYMTIYCYLYLNKTIILYNSKLHSHSSTIRYILSSIAIELCSRAQEKTYTVHNVVIPCNINSPYIALQLHITVNSIESSRTYRHKKKKYPRSAGGQVCTSEIFFEK